MKNLIAIFLFLSFGIANAQKIDSTSLKSTLSFLASDVLKGRKVLTPENDITVEYLDSRFMELNLKPCIGNSYKIPFQYREQTVYNVCAAKPGETDDIIIVSAHFDHVGVKEGENNSDEDVIFNGADDNASGVAAVIGIAEYLANKSTKKTVWFMGFNAEEVGLEGSKALAEHKSINPEKINVIFNFEMLGTVSEYGKNAVFMTGDQRSDFDEMINDLKVKNLTIKEDPYKKYQLFKRSDNYPFAKKGIIAHSFSSVDMKTSNHYHQVNDEIEIFDFENFTNIVNGFAQVVEKFANKKLNPKYSEPVE